MQVCSVLKRAIVWKEKGLVHKTREEKCWPGETSDSETPGIVILGVGSKRGRDDDWIEHQAAFDKLLAGLNAAQGKNDPIALPQSTTAPAKTLAENAAEAKKIVLVPAHLPRKVDDMFL